MLSEQKLTLFNAVLLIVPLNAMSHNCHARVNFVILYYITYYTGNGYLFISCGCASMADYISTLTTSTQAWHESTIGM